jgi:hypothetical protein
MREHQKKEPPFRGTSLEDIGLDGREPVDFAVLLTDFEVHAGAAPHRELPNGYILFSEAIRRLAIRMWGALPPPNELQNVKNMFKEAGESNARIEWGRWREKAAGRLTQAALKAKLAVYVTHQDQDTPTYSIVPSNVLRQLIASRGSLPDHAIRPSIKACDGNESLFVLLKTGCLVVAETEFSAWLQTEHRKGRWPSQRSRKKAVVGAPGKQTEALRNAILARVRKGVWSGDKSIVGLRQLLIDSARDDVPSADTLARLVDELHDETGEPGLSRVKRVRRKRST